MSMNANYSGNVQKPDHVVLAGATLTAITAAAPNGNATAAAWSVVNPTGAAVNCEIYWSDGTTDYLVWRKAVAANSTEVESNLPIRLLQGHSIKAIGVNTVTVTVIQTLSVQTQ